MTISMMWEPVESPDEVADDDHKYGKAQNGSVPQLQDSTGGYNLSIIFVITLILNF